MKAFITATGTDIGKTHVTCGLLRHAVPPTLALKPVVTGYDPAAAPASDPGRLLAAQNLPIDPVAIAAIAPWRFAAPVSPDWAAELEGRAIGYPALLGFCRDALNRPGSVLIEGIGGVMVPLTDQHTVLDLCADLALPVVLVAGTYLGTLSHTLSALAVLRARGLRVVVALNPSPTSAADPAVLAATIERHAPVSVVAPAGGEPDASGLARLLDRWSAPDR